MHTQSKYRVKFSLLTNLLSHKNKNSFWWNAKDELRSLFSLVVRQLILLYLLFVHNLQQFLSVRDSSLQYSSYTCTLMNHRPVA